jgi:hypothetical protein
MLFNMVLEEAVRTSGIEERDKIYHRLRQIVACVDDIDIIGRRDRTAGEAFENLERTA